MTAGFASQASVAIELAAARAEHQRCAVHDERDRIAADLHDHVIQRLFATGVALQSSIVATRPPARPPGALEAGGLRSLISPRGDQGLRPHQRSRGGVIPG